MSAQRDERRGGGVVSGWNLAALVTAGLSALGGLVVLLTTHRIETFKPQPDPTP